MDETLIVHVQESESQEQEQIPPLLKPQKNGNGNHDVDDTDLDKTLQKLELFLTLLGFNQSSVLSFVLSWIFFLVLGILVPMVMLEVSNCQNPQIKSFEFDILVSQALLAAASLLCLSHNLRKYGIRKFLFVDRYSGHIERFSNQYHKKISDSVRLLLLWVLPCFLLKTAREIIRILYVQHESWWQSAAISLAFVSSWTYITAIFLSACVLFHLVCSLQIIHFDDYVKFLEREPDCFVLIQEHVRLRYYLSKISHRFRIYLLLLFLIVIVSHFMTLFQTTGYTGLITYINGGDFAVSSIVQVVGVILCLNAAAKISHRAQGIGSIASRWHALATCTSGEASQMRNSTSMSCLEAANRSNSFYMNFSESDLESVDFVTEPTNTQLASYMSSYQKRQALVMYLQNNPGGITIFGWTVDRGLINTIFFIELTVVTFILGKTIVFTGQ
uniref:Extracellular ligand-gated ion channel n=1 Tax=Solanum tuberosum TaxID=4113 RepID=M1BW43_SOLTU